MSDGGQSTRLTKVHLYLAALLMALVSTVNSVGPALAQSNPTLSVGSGSGLPGSTGKLIPVSLGSNTAASALQFNLNFDSNKLTVSQVSVGSAASGKTVESNVSSGSVSVVIYGGTSTIGNGTLVNVTFNILSSASAGQVPLTLSNVVASDSNANTVQVTTSNGSITILQAAPSSTPIHTPTRTLTATVTPSQTPSRTPTATFTPSRTVTPGPSPTPSLTPTPSMTFTPSPTRPTATPSITNTFDPNASPTWTSEPGRARLSSGPTSGPGGFSNLLSGEMETAVVETATALAETEADSSSDKGLPPASSGLSGRLISFAQSWLGVPVLIVLAAIEIGLLAMMIRTFFP